jgi:hypothetical protein
MTRGIRGRGQGVGSEGELMSKGVPWARMQKESPQTPHHLLCNGEGEGAVRVPRTPVFIKGEGLGVESVSRCRLSIVAQAAARGPGSGFANIKPSR